MIILTLLRAIMILIVIMVQSLLRLAAHGGKGEPEAQTLQASERDKWGQR